LFVCFFPEPPQLLQGFLISSPLPAHWGHVCWTVKKPWLDLTLPCPPHVEHGLGLEPGADPCPLQVPHFSDDEKLIFSFFPV